MSRKSSARNQQNSPQHPIRKEIKGLICLLLSVILGVSFLSYHPADKLIWNVTGSLGPADNLFGTVGAHFAGATFDLIGFSAFWLVIIFLTMAVLAFRGQAPSRPLTTLAAVIVLLTSFSMLLNLQLDARIAFKGVEIEAGGLIGLHLAAWAKNFLNYFGAYVLGVTVFVISLMLATRLSLGWLLSKIGLWILRIVRPIREARRKKFERSRRARKTQTARQKLKSKPKVNIVEPARPSEKKPEQEIFSFMHYSGQFKLPHLGLLNDPPKKENIDIHRESLEMNARRLERKLADFGVQGEVIEILPGPVITMYEFKPAPGVKISKVAGLSDDLALTLRAPSIRIVAPIPGKAAIGIEIPNSNREMVYLKEILGSSEYQESKHKLPIALGHDITGAPVITDLTKMPHLLVAGATGSGKSASINTMLNSILFKSSPDAVRLLLIDPKRIELSIYHDTPHLLHPVVTQPKEATRALGWAINEMERRYTLLSDRGVRTIESYNRKLFKERQKRSAEKADGAEEADSHLPYVVVVIDELADLMMAASREVEEAITRLAQMARAAGIHLIIATQRPSVDVLTGVIKANFPSRISFQVSSRVDSRTILDSIGAENLLGDGDMLFMPPGLGRLTRIHGAYVSEEEIKAVTDFLRTQKQPEYDPRVVSEVARAEQPDDEQIERDEKYDAAIEVVAATGQASISMLQRKLRVGYNRAARMIELMEKEGIVGPSDGVKPREVHARRGEQ